MTRVLQIITALVLLCLAFPASAFADDWLVTKLRGEALQVVGADWAPLERGDVVPDDRVIRTLGSGRAMLQRGAETIEVAANTQIRILDKAGAKPFTTVQQYFGTVSIEAEVRNVQHFAVQTPYLAAVVKGTRFEVKTSSKQSTVKVQRGHVAVEDLRTGANTLLAKGQTATIARDGSFKVGGQGKPTIVNAAGQVVAAAAAAKGNLDVTVGGNGVSAGVQAGIVGGNVSVGGDGVAVGVDVGGGVVGVDAGVDGGGVQVGGNVGGTGVGVSVGGGDGVSVNVGGTSVNLGLGGLL